jgi:hypothetical protein
MSRCATITSCAFLLLAAAGCGERETTPTVQEVVLDTLYAEPAGSREPLLLFPRDLLWHQERLFVLDGRSARVGIFDAAGGGVLGSFGGLGEGPGELGQFPYALVTDGERIGVAHLANVSWFTPEGRFLERERLPAIDLATPSLLRVGEGWLFNCGYRGGGSPVALRTGADGDTIGFGAAVAPPLADRSGSAGSELNAVQVGRFPNGNVLLAWVQYPWVDLCAPDGTLLSRNEDSELARDLERRPDGRLRSVPGYILSAGTGADGLVYLVDGTFRNIRAFSADGRERVRLRLREGAVMKVTAGADGSLWAIGLEDALYRIRNLDQEATPEPDTAVPARDPSAESATRVASDRLPAFPFPGRLLPVVEDVTALLQDHDVDRPTVLRDAPARIEVRAGERVLFLGYGDGQGLLLAEGPDGWEVDRALSTHPERTARSRIRLAGDRVYIMDIGKGLFEHAPPQRSFFWPGDWFVNGAVALGGDQWLIHDATPESVVPLQLVDLAGGEVRPAGAAGRHRRVESPWRGAVNQWHLDAWGEGRVVVLDEGGVRFAFWAEPDGLGPWTAISGSGLRTFEARRHGRILDTDVGGWVALPGRGLLVLAGEDLPDFRRRNRVLLIDPAGRTIAHWILPTEQIVHGFTALADGRIFLNTRRALFEWSGAREAVAEVLAEDASTPSGQPPPWLDRDLPGLLGPLTTLDGDPLDPTVEAGRCLYVLISDRECFACLEELPRLALRLHELDCDGLPVRVVALGDRHEARRTLWGMDHFFPVAISARPEARDCLGFKRTPLRVVTEGGRIVYAGPAPEAGKEGSDPLESFLRGPAIPEGEGR